MISKKEKEKIKIEESRKKKGVGLLNYSAPLSCGLS